MSPPIFTSADKGVPRPARRTATRSTRSASAAICAFIRRFDGMAANGLRYGASVELRENFHRAYRSLRRLAPPAACSQPAPAPTPPPRPYSSAAPSPTSRRIRPASSASAKTDGVIGLFDNCIFTIAVLGRRHRQLQRRRAPGSSVPWAAPAFRSSGWPRLARNTTTHKIVYLSPQYLRLRLRRAVCAEHGQLRSRTQAPASAAPRPARPARVSSGNDATRWITRLARPALPADVRAGGLQGLWLL